MKKVTSLMLALAMMLSVIAVVPAVSSAEFQYNADDTMYFSTNCAGENVVEGEPYAVKITSADELSEKWRGKDPGYDKSVFEEAFLLCVNWTEPCLGLFHEVSAVVENETSIDIELSELPPEKDVDYADVMTPYCAVIKLPKEMEEKEVRITVNKITYISTAADLKEFSDSVNSGNTYEGKTVMLTRDIDLSEICGADINGAAVSWTPIGTKENRFNGNFDGGGHSINNAYITHTDVGSGLYRDGPYYIGLFGYAESGSVIKNLNIDGSIEINGDLLMIRPPSRALHYIGAVAGYSGGSIQNCHSTVSIDISGNTNYYGGIVGWLEGKTERCSNSGMLAVDDKGFGGIVVAGGICGIIGKGASIYDCFNTGDVDGLYAGGIIGSSTNDSIGVFNCYNAANILGNDENATGQIGDYTTASIKNCYYLGDEESDGQVIGKTVEQFSSGEVAYLLGEAWGQKIGTDKYPVQGGDKVYFVNDKYTNNLPSEEKEYKINGSFISINDEFSDTVKLSSFEEYESFKETHKEFAPYIEQYDKTYFEDKLIYLLNIEPSDSGTSQFEFVSYSVGDDILDIVVSKTHDGVTDDVVSWYLILETDQELNNRNVKLKYNQIKYISTAQELKAFAEEVNAGNTYEHRYVELTRSINLSEVCGADIDGGEVSWTPIGVYSDDGKEKFKGTFDGCGHAISNMYINRPGSIYQQSDLGLFGEIEDAVIKDLMISGTIIGGDLIGGIVGRNEKGSKIEHCTSNVNVLGEAYSEDEYEKEEYYVGGIAGDNDGIIISCKNNGDVVSEGMFTGGIAGCNNGVIEECENYGSVSGADDFVGGITGFNDGTPFASNGIITNSCNRGDVTNTGKADCTGGITGRVHCGEIKGCYNTGAVISEGKYNGSIAGTVSSVKYADTILERYFCLITNCFYLQTPQVNSDLESAGLILYDEDIVEAYSKTAEQFASGEVAYLLGEAWGQKIGEDEYPVLGGEKVYLVNDSYTNTPSVKKEPLNVYMTNKFARTDYDDSPIIIKSYDELEQLVLSDESRGQNDYLLEEYQKSYFENKFLYARYVAAGFVGGYYVRGAEETENSINIDIILRRSYYPTCVISAWYLFAEIDKGSLGKEINVNVYEDSEYRACEILYKNSRISIVNHSGMEQKADVYAARYDDNGILKGIEKLTDTIPETGYEKEVTLEAGDKVFAWNNMKPVAEPLEIEEEKSYAQRLMSLLPEDENYVVSPLSLKMAMMMAANGADGGHKSPDT